MTLITLISSRMAVESKSNQMAIKQQYRIIVTTVMATLCRQTQVFPPRQLYKVSKNRLLCLVLVHSLTVGRWLS